MAVRKASSAAVRAATFVVAIALVASRPGVAHADEPTAAEIAMSHEQMNRGLAAAQRGDWIAAREAFARAYALDSRPAVLFDLAGAQTQTGQLLAGAESYRRFLRESPDHQDEARQALG